MSLPLLGSGAGNGAIAIHVDATLPANASPATFAMQAFVLDGGVPLGFSSSKGLNVVLQ